MKLLKTIPALLFLSFTPLQASVVLLADYEIGTVDIPSLSATSVNASITASDLVSQNTSTFSGVIAGTGSTNEVLAIAPTAAQSSLSSTQTLSDSSYFSFTITPTAGTALTLQSLSFKVTTSGSSTPRAFYLLSSVTGFNDSSVIFWDNNSTGSLNSSGFTTYVATFTSAFENITTPTEFRFYIQAPTIYAQLRFDSIMLYGTVLSIPEPPILSLFITALACCSFLYGSKIISKNKKRTVVL